MAREREIRQGGPRWPVSSELDCATLLELGGRLDRELGGAGGQSVREFLGGALLRIRDKSGRLRRLEPNEAQQNFESRCGRRNIVLKARQVGMTTWIAARFFLYTITHAGSVTVQVAHDQEAAESIFRIVRRFAGNLPEPLRRGALRTSRSNTRQLIFPQLDSEYRVETAASVNAGRGLTIRNLHASEVARWPGDAAETLAALRAAVTPQGEVTLESTPNGAQGCFYSEWLRAEENGYVRHFFPWWIDRRHRLELPLAEALSAEELRLMEEHGLDEQQIAFRRDVQANFGARASEEYAEDAESCFLHSGDCVFDGAKLEQRIRAAGEPLEREEHGALEIWYPVLAGKEYLMGVDPAGGGTRGDYSCLQVIDKRSGVQCAEWYGHASPEELAQKAAALGRRYNRALLVVERNNHGAAVLAQLRTVARYGNLYGEDGQAGWLTNCATRPAMLAHLIALMSVAPELFSSRRLLGECRTFVRGADGRMAAAEGCHDDAVMAMAMAQGIRERGA
jgi:hypothetical protein